MNNFETFITLGLMLFAYVVGVFIGMWVQRELDKLKINKGGSQ